MKEEFEKMVAAGKLQSEHVAPLVEMATSGFCQHRKWGCGKITTIDTVFGRLTIDFPEKPGHSMDMGFAAELLTPIPKDHILARKITDLAGLKQVAALNHLELIKVVLQSFGGEATLDQIQEVLVPDVIADDWKKWWEAAKKEMKKSGHFKIPLKKAHPIVYQSEEISIDNRLLEDFRNAKGLKARMVVMAEVLKSSEDFENLTAASEELIPLLNENIVSHQRTQPSLALEAILARDELQEKAGVSGSETALTTVALWNQVGDHLDIFINLPAVKQKLALETYKEASEQWANDLMIILNDFPAKLCGESFKLLIENGYAEEAKTFLSKLIHQHQANTELLLWLAKDRSDFFADILGPEVFRAMMTAIERDQFNEKRTSRLADFVMKDQGLLQELLEFADIDIIKDVTRTLQLSPSFEDMDKRSLLARIVKQYPSIQSMISGDSTESSDDNRLIVSRSSLDRRRVEYEDLVKKKIPDNSKEIAIARSYGDLRENHEYKSAKEMQKLLMQRKAELEVGLTNAQATDFADTNTDAVSIGCVVEVTDVSSGSRETFTLLGAWDSDIDKGVISYQTPLAQSILGHKAGEEVDFEMGSESKRYRIESIKAAYPNGQRAAEGQ